MNTTPESPCTWWGYPRLATSRTPLDVALLYVAVLRMRHTGLCMAQSNHHAAVMMGEYDDPPDEPPVNQSNKALQWAGFFGVATAADLIKNILFENPYGHHSHGYTPGEKTEFIKRIKQMNRNGGMAYGCMTQLLYAVLDDDDGLAEIAKYYRTNYLGSPNDEDCKMVQPLRDWIRKLIRHLDMAEEAWKTGEFNQLLISSSYRNGKYEFSAPIPYLEFIIEEEGNET